VNAETKTLAPGPEADGARLDVWVGEALGLSRARLKRLFEAGAVKVGGRPAKKGDKVRGGVEVSVVLEEEQTAAAPSTELPLTVLHEDAWLIAVEKPAGVPTHPLKPGEVGTVANALVARYPECQTASDDPREGGVCHRLDVETSGVLLAARDRETWTKVRSAFGARDVEKRYFALVTGPIADEGEIDLPLRHPPRHADRMEGAPDGGKDAREALSRFRVISRAADYAFVDVEILTGVQHQIRAHLAAIGAPIVGDAIYRGREEPLLSRFFLHAHKLGLTHPETGKRLVVESPLPAELEAVLAAHGLTSAPR
jgi:23S rRNA pseudouridine1911/1915/1917 synthase